MNQTKVCNTCLNSKELSSFYLKKKKYYRNKCKECCKKEMVVYNRSWRRLNKQKDRGYHKKYETSNKERLSLLARERKLKREFGLSELDYQTMLSNQSNGCFICKAIPTTKRRLSVDHDHITGKIRGLLCWPCNFSLGLLKEDKQRLNNMINYINLFKDK